MSRETLGEPPAYKKDTMNKGPKTQTRAPWELLRESLPGSFIVRARGLLGNDFVLLGADGSEHGHLKILGDRKAKFTVDGVEILAERTSGPCYTMFSGGEEVLVARPSGVSPDELEVRCGEQSYTASISLFRNRAVAYNEAGDEAVRLVGKLMGRSYKVEVDSNNPCALPISILLIYHTSLSRRRAYRTAG